MRAPTFGSSLNVTVFRTIGCAVLVASLTVAALSGGCDEDASGPVEDSTVYFAPAAGVYEVSLRTMTCDSTYDGEDSGIEYVCSAEVIDDLLDVPGCRITRDGDRLSVRCSTPAPCGYEIVADGEINGSRWTVEGTYKRMVDGLCTTDYADTSCWRFWIDAARIAPAPDACEIGIEPSTIVMNITGGLLDGTVTTELYGHVPDSPVMLETLLEAEYYEELPSPPNAYAGLHMYVGIGCVDAGSLPATFPLTYCRSAYDCLVVDSVLCGEAKWNYDEYRGVRDVYEEYLLPDSLSVTGSITVNAADPVSQTIAGSLDVSFLGRWNGVGEDTRTISAEYFLGQSGPLANSSAPAAPVPLRSGLLKTDPRELVERSREAPPHRPR